jgi:hypothetical protein
MATDPKVLAALADHPAVGPILSRLNSGEPYETIHRDLVAVQISSTEKRALLEMVRVAAQSVERIDKRLVQLARDRDQLADRVARIESLLAAIAVRRRKNGG